MPGPRLELFLSRKKGNVANVEVLSLDVHTATHVDAPFHFFSELRHIDELPHGPLLTDEDKTELNQILRDLGLL